MPWFKLDDSFGAHPKVIHAGNAATGLWVRCATYSAQYLLDGHIPYDVARRYGKPSEIQTLLDVGLWQPNGTGYVMPDYLEFNPSKEQVGQERAANRERQARRRRNQQNGTYE